MIDMLQTRRDIAKKAIEENGYAVPMLYGETLGEGLKNAWQKGRRIAPNHFRRMRSVWNAPWFPDKDSAVKNLGLGMAKVGRLAWMSVGATVAGATFALQSITKPFAWAGKKLHAAASKFGESKNPLKRVLGWFLLASSYVCKVIDAPVRAVCVASGALVSAVFNSHLSSRYGIESQEPIRKDTLEAAAKKVAKNEQKLIELTKALNKTNFETRTKEVSRVMSDALGRVSTEGPYTDETIGIFLSSVKKQIKLSERESEKAKSIKSSGFSRGRI